MKPLRKEVMSKDTIVEVPVVKTSRRRKVLTIGGSALAIVATAALVAIARNN